MHPSQFARFAPLARLRAFSGHALCSVLLSAGAGACLLACSAAPGPTESSATSSSEAPAAADLHAVLGNSRAPDAWLVPQCAGGCDAACTDGQRFIVRDGTVKDTLGTMIWQRDTGPALALADAVAYCEGLHLGATGWRLPKADELASLEYKPGYLQAGQPQYCAPAIDQAAFPATQQAYYWTSDTVDGDRPGAFAISFFDGRGHSYPADQELSVRCVHD